MALWQAVSVRWWDWYGDGRWAVATLGLACCVVETEAATLGRRAVPEPPVGARRVVVVAGTVTDAVAPLVARAVAAADAVVVSFGACACAGGPYWDSPVVTKGVDELVAVDHYLPGCPPSPGALTDLLDALRRQADRAA